MKKLKEINGKYYQECQVHLLEASEANSNYTNLWMDSRTKKLDIATLVSGSKSNKIIKFQNLYITSNEEIKEGDWCLFFWDGGQVGSLPNQYKPSKGHVLNNGLRKIVATTDSSLELVKDLGEISQTAILPQPSKQFVQKYIEEFNKENIIEKVLVEYGKYPDGFDLEDGTQYSYNLKTDSHNCITIKPIKDSWTREEVKDLISDWTRMSSGLNLNLPREKFDKWVENNL